MTWYTPLRRIDFTTPGRPGELVAVVVEDNTGQFTTVGTSALARSFRSADHAAGTVDPHALPIERARQWMNTSGGSYLALEPSTEDATTIPELRTMSAAPAARLAYEGQPRESGRFSEGKLSTAETEKPAPIEQQRASFKTKFDRAFAHSPYSAFVNHYTEAEMRDGNMTPLTSNNGDTGLLIHDHGDGRVEATALYNVSDVPGAGIDLLRDAVDNHGVNYVECFGPYLPTLYSQLGFRVAESYPFDPHEAPSNWNMTRFDSPDYVTMKLAR